MRPGYIDEAAQIVGIEAQAEVTSQFLQAVVPDGRVSPPGADQVIHRDHDVRAADEEVEDLVLGGDKTASLTERLP